MTGRAEAEAAAIVRECRRVLASRGSTILGEAVGAANAMIPWRHYPEGEAYDPLTQAQYFYHRHAEAAPDGAEHGHFHLFLRAEGMPAGIAPLVLPELAVANVAIPPQAAPLKRGGREEVSHLVAIAVNAAGEPIRLFTTNRWVTGETWYRAEDVLRMLDRFAIDTALPSRELNRWLAAIVRLFRPEIAALLRERDRTVMAWRRRRRVHVFEDARLEITSTIGIDLEARLAAAERMPAMRRRSRLPRMAEGWIEEGSPG